MLSGKNILLGISGGIAAYKIPSLIRLICKENGQVKCILTDSSTRFVTRETLFALAANTVYDNLFASQNSIDHIELARWADIFVIAPATANTIGKMTHGIADNLLSTACLSYKGQLLIAPAMNAAMWEHAAVQENISVLRKRGILICGPESGELACGENGSGRMAEPATILEWIVRAASGHFLRGKKVLVTAGPTREPIDSVRYISNASSGKMGYALALSAWHFKADVTLISGPAQLICIPAIRKIDVKTAEEMFRAVKKEFASCDIFISNAAVSDIRCKAAENKKIKKKDFGGSIEIEQTPDILKWAGKNKKRRTIIGFALETESEEENARLKLEQKFCDYLAVNNPARTSSGIGGDYNEVVLFSRKGERAEFSNRQKRILSRDLLTHIFQSALT